MNRMTKILPALMVASVAMAGCDSLLEVTDPDLVTPDNVQGERGAELYWAGALGQFAAAFSSGGGGQALYSGMLADEFHLSGTFPTRNEVDRREMDTRNGTLLGEYRNLHQARVGLKNAAQRLEELLPGDSRIAEMWSLNGFTYLFFGEHYCSGVPFSDTPNEGDVVYSGQIATDEMWNRALASFSAASGATAGDANQSHLASVGEARALLNQGNYSAAAAAVAGVPDEWVYLIRSKTGGAFGQRNALYEMNHSQRRWSLSPPDESLVSGFNGLNFRRDPADPRLPWEDSGDFGFDEETPLFHQLKFSSWENDTPLASGIEARLIEAEADLNGAATEWLTILNDLRGTVAGLDDLTDPGTFDARVDLLFEERAFWLFGTAHRLGDLRRLVRQYGRAADAVFPSGAFFKGGTYGPDVNFPIPFEELENPELSGLTGQVCLNRDA